MAERGECEHVEYKNESYDGEKRVKETLNDSNNINNDLFQ